MIRKFIYLLTLLTFACTFTSCADSPEKLMEDQAEHIEELTSLLEKYEAGKISASKVEEEMEQWAKEWKRFDERLDKLYPEESGHYNQTAYSKYQHIFKQPSKDFFDTAQRLDKTGKWTNPMNDCIDKICVDHYSFANVIIVNLDF